MGLQQLLLYLLLVVSTGGDSSYDPSPRESYWPERLPVVRRSRRQFSRPFILKSPSDDAESASYPVVLTPRQAFVDGSDIRLSYRPEPLVAPYTERPLRRPVITIDPEQLPYGKPYVRIPYQETRPRVRRPIIRRPVPPREFGPFGPSGPLADFPTLDNRIQEEFPAFVTTPYAPTYKNYIPSLRFHHIMDPGTGDYDVEYDTANGIYRKESGFTKIIQVYNPVTRTYGNKAINVKTGTVSWTSPEGIPFSYSYIADENGYRPTPLVQSLSPKSLAANPSNTYQNVLIPYN